MLDDPNVWGTALMLLVLFACAIVASVVLHRWRRELPQDARDFLDGKAPTKPIEPEHVAPAAAPAFVPPYGISTVASMLREPQPDDPKERFETVREEGSPTAVWKCGHQHPTRFHFNVFGERMDARAGVSPAKDDCPECNLRMLAAHSIRCCVCGGHIGPNSTVAAYPAGDAPRIDVASRTPDGRNIGCLRYSCETLQAAFFLAGAWTGYQFRQHQRLVGGSAGSHAAATGQAVLVPSTDDVPTE